MERLPQLQRAILRECCAQYVQPGGVLLYSTCTVLRRENEDVWRRRFCRQHPEFCAEVIPLPDGLRVQDARFADAAAGQHDCDGFFICKMRKTGMKTDLKSMTLVRDAGGVRALGEPAFRAKQVYHMAAPAGVASLSAR